MWQWNSKKRLYFCKGTQCCIQTTRRRSKFFEIIILYFIAIYVYIATRLIFLIVTCVKHMACLISLTRQILRLHPQLIEKLIQCYKEKHLWKLASLQSTVAIMSKSFMTNFKKYSAGAMNFIFILMKFVSPYKSRYVVSIHATIEMTIT